MKACSLESKSLGTEFHLPPGSADGNWQVIDLESDNGDVIAVVDPDNILAEMGDSAEAYARLFANAPKLLAAAKAMRDGWEKNLTDAMAQINAAIDAIEAV